MSAEPLERGQLQIRSLAFGLLVDRTAACSDVVAPLARLLVRRVDERALHDQLPQIGEDGRSLGGRGRLDLLPLLLALVAREVILGAGDPGVLVFAAEQFGGRESIERVLQTTATVEGALPVIAPEAAGLVVENLELRGADLVDTVDPPGNSERQ